MCGTAIKHGKLPLGLSGCVFVRILVLIYDLSNYTLICFTISELVLLNGVVLASNKSKIVKER